MGPPASISELNERAARWINERIHSRLHRGIGEVPADRFAIEATLLGALPRRRFDTAYVEPRRVHVAIPRSNGVACGTRCHRAASASGSKSARRSGGTPSRSAGPAELVGSSPGCILWCAPEVWDAAHFAGTETAALSPHPGHHLALVLPDEMPVSRPDPPRH